MEKTIANSHHFKNFTNQHKRPDLIKYYGY